jgi:hypothetical protein
MAVGVHGYPLSLVFVDYHNPVRLYLAPRTDIPTNFLYHLAIPAGVGCIIGPYICAKLHKLHNAPLTILGFSPDANGAFRLGQDAVYPLTLIPNESTDVVRNCTDRVRNSDDGVPNYIDGLPIALATPSLWSQGKAVYGVELCRDWSAVKVARVRKFAPPGVQVRRELSVWRQKREFKLVFPIRWW